LTRLNAINTEYLQSWVQEAKIQSVTGNVLDRIPPLATVNPRLFGVYICCQGEKTYSAGDTDCIFPLMSTVKPFALLYLLEHFGAEKVLQWVGIEPSAAPFNSLEQLVTDGGFPRNPMINSGAITLADKFPGEDGYSRSRLFYTWLNKLSGSEFQLDEYILDSVRCNTSNKNQAIAHYLYQVGRIHNVHLAIDTYEQICCLAGKVKDLAKLGKLLACESDAVSSQHRRIVNAVMLTCGLYEASAEFAVKVGLPMKSGIGGGLVAIAPNQGAIACYSPALDSVGNPVAGLAFMQTLSQQLQLTIFT
jgi:glutaminase